MMPEWIGSLLLGKAQEKNNEANHIIKPLLVVKIPRNSPKQKSTVLQTGNLVSPYNEKIRSQKF